METSDTIPYDDESISSDHQEGSCRSRTGSIKTKELPPTEESIKHDAMKKRKKIRNCIGYITIFMLVIGGILILIIMSAINRRPIFYVTHPVTSKPVTVQTRSTTTVLTTTMKPFDDCQRTFVALTKNMGVYVAAVAIADLNNDNKIDIVFICELRSSLYVMLNMGNNKFADWVQYPTTNVPLSLAVADVNGDSYPDVILGLNENSYYLSVFLNDGDGSYNKRTKINMNFSQAIYSVMANDVNDDGKSDIIIAISDNNSIGVSLNKGDAIFDEMKIYSVGELPMSVYAIDLNEDKKSDLMVANTKTNTMSILYNQGDGTFSDPIDYSVDTGPVFVTATDLNKDNRSDIILLNYFSNNVVIYLNFGDENFTRHTNFSCRANALVVAWSDYNSDGSIDIIVPNYHSNNVDVFFNDGDGLFSTPVTYTAYPLPRVVAVADINDDNKPDIILGDGNYVGVILSDCEQYL